MFKVYDNALPADNTKRGAASTYRSPEWAKSSFGTKEEAYKYAYLWLGEAYRPNMTVEDALRFNLFDEHYTYSAYEDTIVVREF